MKTRVIDPFEKIKHFLCYINIWVISIFTEFKKHKKIKGIAVER